MEERHLITIPFADNDRARQLFGEHNSHLKRVAEHLDLRVNTRGTTVFIDAPLGPSLRVPFGAAFLRVASPLLESGDRVLDVSIPVDNRLLSPRNRTDLYQSVRSEAFEGVVRLHVVRGREPVVIEASLLNEPGWRRAAREWPTLFLGIVFLLFGMMVALTSPHPVATPLFAVSCGAILR